MLSGSAKSGRSAGCGRGQGTTLRSGRGLGTRKSCRAVRAGAALNEEQVIAYTKTKLAGYKCPKRVEFRTELARTATGKLQKFKLRAPYWEGRERQVN